MNWKIPFADIDMDEAEAAAVTAVLNRRWLTQGGETAAFEEAFQAYLQTEHAVAVSNATAALHMALQALEIGPGDEVLVPSLTFIATVNAVLYVGARPVFVEIAAPHDLTLSPSDLERKRTPATAAVIVMHYGGYPCDMNTIMPWARRYGVAVIEDAAHAPGGRLDGRALGTLGDIGCFSFFSNKNMTTGEGGMAVTASAELARSLRSLRSHGMTWLTWDRHQGHGFSYDVVDLGYNYRTTEIAAALGRIQLGRLDGNNRRRGRLVARYIEQFSSIPGVTVPFDTYRGEPAWHLFSILLDDATRRKALMEALRDGGIQCSIHYPPAHLFTWHRQHLGTSEGLLPLTEDLARRLVTLPLFPHLGESGVDTVVAAVRQALRP